MRTTKRTGAWWFMQEISKFLDRKPPDSDGEHFITNTLVTKQIDWLSELRNLYCYILLLKRILRKKNEQSQLRHWLNHKAPPGKIYTTITYKRINELYPQISAIEKRLSKLPNPYDYCK